LGTRAIIKFGNTFIATHWDGYPDSLGSDLKTLKNFTLEEVVKVAESHGIDFATEDVMALTSYKRYEKIVNKANEMKGKKYTPEELKEMYEKEGKILMFGVQSAGDYPIGNFDNYGDFAEYIYDVSEKSLRYAELSGSWEGMPKNLKWKKL